MPHPCLSMFELSVCEKKRTGMHRFFLPLTPTQPADRRPPRLDSAPSGTGLGRHHAHRHAGHLSGLPRVAARGEHPRVWVSSREWTRTWSDLETPTTTYHFNRTSNTFLPFLTQKFRFSLFGLVGFTPRSSPPLGRDSSLYG